MAFIDSNREDVVEGIRLGVERIRKLLQVAPSTYYAARTRVPSARAGWDAVLRPALHQLWAESYCVYGAASCGRQPAGLAGMWAVPGHSIDAGRGHRRRAAHQAGPHDPGRPRSRHGTRIWSTATAPIRLWVTDLIYLPTWAGVAHMCFIVDVYSRMIVGWRVAFHMRTETVLDAIEMARWSRASRLAGLTRHSDARSPFTSIRDGERLAEIGSVPSIGTIADNSTMHWPGP